MKQRPVLFSAHAKADLAQLYDWIAERAGTRIADGYLDRLETYCSGLEFASERGRRRDDIRRGLRVVGFERRIAIAFVVESEQVVVLRIHYGGRSIEESL